MDEVEERKDEYKEMIGIKIKRREKERRGAWKEERREKRDVRKQDTEKRGKRRGRRQGKRGQKTKL